MNMNMEMKINTNMDVHNKETASQDFSSRFHQSASLGPSRHARRDLNIFLILEELFDYFCASPVY
jgi:hypothetical protein